MATNEDVTRESEKAGKPAGETTAPATRGSERQDSDKPATLGNLLIVDDDERFLQRLGRAMDRRGFAVTPVATVAEGCEAARHAPLDCAVVDLRLNDGNGLEVVQALRERQPDCRIVVLTGYGNIATAVAAVKAGAVDYLSKPADADQIAAALLAAEGDMPPPPDHPMSADRVRWEHIQRVYEQCERNVSETARRLRMHRRTLQRILNKYAPRD
jgi:two-component system response regulator RegA